MGRAANGLLRVKVYRNCDLGGYGEYTPLAEKHGLHLQHYEMRDLHIHDLRRTLGSWLASGGTSLPIIGRALNPKTPEAETTVRN